MPGSQRHGHQAESVFPSLWHPPPHDGLVRVWRSRAVAVLVERCVARSSIRPPLFVCKPALRISGIRTNYGGLPTATPSQSAFCSMFQQPQTS